MTAPRIGIVRWGDPTGSDPTVYYGLRINGAYVARSGQPVGYRSAAEARRAKAAYRAALQPSPTADAGDLAKPTGHCTGGRTGVRDEGPGMPSQSALQHTGEGSPSPNPKGA